MSSSAQISVLAVYCHPLASFACGSLRTGTSSLLVTGTSPESRTCLKLGWGSVGLGGMNGRPLGCKQDQAVSTSQGHGPSCCVCRGKRGRYGGSASQPVPLYLRESHQVLQPLPCNKAQEECSGFLQILTNRGGTRQPSCGGQRKEEGWALGLSAPGRSRRGGGGGVHRLPPSLLHSAPQDLLYAWGWQTEAGIPDLVPGALS